MSSSSSTSKRFSRVLSLRGDRHRNRSRSRPRTDFLNLHTLEEAKRKLTKDEEKKVQEIKQQLSVLGLTEVPESRIEYAIKTKSSEGDVKKALRTIVMIEDAAAGVLSRYDPSVKLLGAENREKVTCYLDTLLFAMFAKPDVFEAMLFRSYEDDEPRRRLVTLIRLWVNLLRNGRLVTVDLMQKIQETLAECGWPEAARAQQQDVSEAFCFITDKLDLPLLTLQTDLFHAGKVDAEDDHKFITERMLDVAIPENVPPADETVTLEQCLEEYFNNRVEVKRHLLRKATLTSAEKVPVVHIDSLEADSEPPPPIASMTDQSSSPQRPAPLRERALSIFSERKVEVLDAADSEESPEAITNGTGAERPPPQQRANSMMRKEVMMPAWQFLNLIPWYTGLEPSTDAHTKEHFSAKRPMLGICLKRYKVSPNGTSSRLNTHIDIPLEMSSPRFASADGLDLEDHDLPTGNFKLSLQSVICHRGIAVDSGHYIALLRAGPTQQRSSAFVDAPETHLVPPEEGDPSQQDTWLCFDDLASERVRRVDITKSLRDESPYILFYRVQPIDSPSGLDSPPPYSESSESFDLVDQKLATYSENGGGGGGNGGDRRSLDVLNSQRPSPRISIDVTSLDDINSNTNGRTSAPSTRRASVAYLVETGESGGINGAATATVTAEPISPTITTAEETKANLTASTKSLPRKDSGSKSSSGSDKRLSGTWSLIAAKLSRDKTSGVATIVVDEVAVEEQAPATTTAAPTSIESSREIIMPPSAAAEETGKLKAPEREKEKEKKRKSGGAGNWRSRTSSMNELAERMKRSRRGKRPERECAMM